MIRYALTCDNDDGFDAWFGSSADYDAQAADGRISCPHCGSTAVRKAPMAPAVVRGRNADTSRRAEAVAALRAHVRDTFTYVGEAFPAEARAIHDGEAPDRPIWGEATLAEAKAMAEDGLPVASLPAEIAPIPPRRVN